MPTFSYRVYESLSAGIGSSVYNDQNYDTVYFNEELAHDFASWISWWLNGAQIKWLCGSYSWDRIWLWWSSLCSSLQ